jgi:thiol-disulfide isomerase/thioredoxin
MKRNWNLLVLAWLIAAAATASALFIGEVMGMAPCVLCWYQRIFMFPLAVVLGMACYSDDRRGAIYGSGSCAGWGHGGWLPHLIDCRFCIKSLDSLRFRRVLHRTKAGNSQWIADSLAFADRISRHYLIAFRIHQEDFKMNSKKLTVAVLLGIVVALFLVGMNFYQKRVQNSQMEKVSKAENRMVRFHSPTLGPSDAPVTIVEFFDPACETCRDFYPIVKNLMKQYPNDVRLVLRYAPFHAGSDKVVKLLEASKRQDKYWQTLEAILAAQPSWASHGSPNLDVAYQAAAQTGLDIKKALDDAQEAGNRGCVETRR